MPKKADSSTSSLAESIDRQPEEVRPVSLALVSLVNLREALLENSQEIEKANSLRERTKQRLDSEVDGADLEDDVKSAYLGTLKTKIDLCEVQAEQLQWNREKLLGKLHTALASARSPISTLAKLLCEERTAAECYAKGISRRDGNNDAEMVQNIHRRIVTRAMEVDWEVNGERAVEVARIAINLGNELSTAFAELQADQSAAREA